MSRMCAVQTLASAIMRVRASGSSAEECNPEKIFGASHKERKSTTQNMYLRPDSGGIQSQIQEERRNPRGHVKSRSISLANSQSTAIQEVPSVFTLDFYGHIYPIIRDRFDLSFKCIWKRTYTPPPLSYETQHYLAHSA